MWLSLRRQFGATYTVYEARIYAVMNIPVLSVDSLRYS